MALELGKPALTQSLLAQAPFLKRLLRRLKALQPVAKRLQAAQISLEIAGIRQGNAVRPLSP